MNFELNEEQKMVRDMVRSFADERLRPGEAVTYEGMKTPGGDG